MPYKPGESGNPKGKPKGAKSKFTKFRELLEPHAEELFGKAVEMAMNGDATAMRLCVERLVPAYRAASNTINLPKMKGTPTEQAQAALEAMANGELTLDDANGVLTAITQTTKIKEIDDLEKRISALEAKNG